MSTRPHTGKHTTPSMQSRTTELHTVDVVWNRSRIMGHILSTQGAMPPCDHIPARILRDIPFTPFFKTQAAPLFAIHDAPDKKSFQMRATASHRITIEGRRKINSSTAQMHNSTNAHGQNEHSQVLECSAPTHRSDCHMPTCLFQHRLEATQTHQNKFAEIELSLTKIQRKPLLKQTRMHVLSSFPRRGSNL